MTDGAAGHGELVYGEFEYGGARVVRMEAIDEEAPGYGPPWSSR